MRRTRKIRRSRKNIRNRKGRKGKKGGNIPKLHYITLSTIEKPELDRLKNSASKHGFEVTVLGLEHQTSYKNKQNQDRAFAIKTKVIKNYIKDKNDNDILLYTDAWDVLVYQGSLALLLEKYNKFNKSVVFSAEKNLWPDNPRSNEYADTRDKPFPYLNAGAFMGKIGALKKYCAEYTKNNNNSDRTIDQLFWSNIYLSNKNDVGLDTNAEIFLSLHNTSESNHIFENNIFTYKETNTQPIFIHANGPNKEKLDVFVKNFKT